MQHQLPVQQHSHTYTAYNNTHTRASCRPTRYVVPSRYTYVPHRGEVNQPRRGRTPQRRAFEQSGQQSLCVSPCVLTYLWWITLHSYIDTILPDLHLLQHHHVVCPQDHDPRRAAQPVPRSQGPTGRHGLASTRSHFSARRPVRPTLPEYVEEALSRERTSANVRFRLRYVGCNNSAAVVAHQMRTLLTLIPFALFSRLHPFSQLSCF